MLPFIALHQTAQFVKFATSTFKMAMVMRPLTGAGGSCRSGISARQAPRSWTLANSPRTNGSCTRQSRSILLHKLHALGILYSTSTGHTEEVASMLKQALGSAAAEPQDIGDIEDLTSLQGYDGLIVGAPTWNTGSDEQRSGTSWDDVLQQIAELDLAGKPVACFGCGDSVSYSEYFCDAVEELYTTFSATGATMVGMWPSKGYDHHESKAEIEPGKFCGLCLDQDNQDDLTEGRVNAWAAQVLQDMKVKV